MASQSDRIAALEDGLAAILSALQGGAAQSTPDPTPKGKVAATRAKSSTVKRDLDPFDVVMPIELDDGTTVDPERGVRIIAANMNGPLAKGSRLVPLVVESGRVERSLTRADVEYIRDNAADILAAMDTVDERAQVGAHYVKPAAKK